LNFLLCFHYETKTVLDLLPSLHCRIPHFYGADALQRLIQICYGLMMPMNLMKLTHSNICIAIKDGRL
jgi:hypothetical protein